MSTELRDRYIKTVRAELQKELNIQNVMAVPEIKKVVVSIGMGESIMNSAAMQNAIDDLKKITGQMAETTRARKSISNFKLREGMKIGLKVTLRSDRMHAFLERLIHVSLPRVRDFRGVSATGFDGHGNYNLGLREQIIFPEINYDEIDQIRGLQVTIVTSAKTDEHARALLAALGMPFQKH